MVVYDQVLAKLDFNQGTWNMGSKPNIDFDKISIKSSRSFGLNAKFIKGGLTGKLQLRSGLRKQDIEQLDTNSKNGLPYFGGGEKSQMNESVIDRILSSDSIVSKSIRSKI